AQVFFLAAGSGDPQTRLRMILLHDLEGSQHGFEVVHFFQVPGYHQLWLDSFPGPVLEPGKVQDIGHNRDRDVKITLDDLRQEFRRSRNYASRSEKRRHGPAELIEEFLGPPAPIIQNYPLTPGSADEDGRTDHNEKIQPRCSQDMHY